MVAGSHYVSCHPCLRFVWGQEHAACHLPGLSSLAAIRSAAVTLIPIVSSDDKLAKCFEAAVPNFSALPTSCVSQKAAPTSVYFWIQSGYTRGVCWLFWTSFRYLAGMANPRTATPKHLLLLLLQEEVGTSWCLLQTPLWPSLVQYCEMTLLPAPVIWQVWNTVLRTDKDNKKLVPLCIQNPPWLQWYCTAQIELPTRALWRVLSC